MHAGIERAIDLPAAKQTTCPASMAASKPKRSKAVAPSGSIFYRKPTRSVNSDRAIWEEFVFGVAFLAADCWLVVPASAGKRSEDRLKAGLRTWRTHPEDHSSRNAQTAASSL